MTMALCTSLRRGCALAPLLWLFTMVAGDVWGQPNSKTNSDVLLFTDGERLTGHFVKSSGTTLTFKSDALGDITVDWKKVKELQTSEKVAVIAKGVRIRKPQQAGNIPQGILSVQDQQVHLTPPTPQPIPLASTADIIDQAGFDKAINHQPGILGGWKGTITVGAALVNATQDSETFTSAVNLVRAIPAEDWLEPRNRTIVNLTESYGEVTQPHTPTILTSIFHGDVERDEYFSRRVYAFGQAAFDHNYSQGLQLQQTYSGGIGYGIIQNDNEMLDVKGSASYVRQQFAGAMTQDLIGSIFGEDFNRKFKHGLTLDQHFTFTPTWNNTKYYMAAFNALLTMPVYKHINGSVGFIDSYLNHPPAAFRKNSVQATVGLTYVLP